MGFIVILYYGSSHACWVAPTWSLHSQKLLSSNICREPSVSVLILTSKCSSKLLAFLLFHCPIQSQVTVTSDLSFASSLLTSLPLILQSSSLCPPTSGLSVPFKFKSNCVILLLKTCLELPVALGDMDSSGRYFLLYHFFFSSVKLVNWSW